MDKQVHFLVDFYPAAVDYKRAIRENYPLAVNSEHLKKQLLILQQYLTQS